MRARCDNGAVNDRYSKEPILMQMLRCLLFLEACCQFILSAIHLPGVNNDLADDLSRNRLSCFLQK